uniref:Uncharacterized protein n=1 Tax=Sinocyclocheilus anshuiensis TaxID=1608454 RepID=A0A671KDI6_9TELE
MCVCVCCRPVEEAAQGECLLSGEEQLTLITESMSITSSDEEKLQLLNKNTELRRLNKELMKLNEEWDHIYHSTSVGLQQRVAALEEESRALKQLNSRLEYYEQTLMQELKKNQHLQEYVRLLESRLHQTDLQQWTRGTQVSLQNQSDHLRLAEVQDLKEQLVALRCQTKIYEADYKTEQKDHERMLQENKRLRRREADMRQQMALLQEQVSTESNQTPDPTILAHHWILSNTSSSVRRSIPPILICLKRMTYKDTYQLQVYALLALCKHYIG